MRTPQEQAPHLGLDDEPVSDSIKAIGDEICSCDFNGDDKK